MSYGEGGIAEQLLNGKKERKKKRRLITKGEGEMATPGEGGRKEKG